MVVQWNERPRRDQLNVDHKQCLSSQSRILHNCRYECLWQRHERPCHAHRFAARAPCAAIGDRRPISIQLSPVGFAWIRPVNAKVPGTPHCGAVAIERQIEPQRRHTQFIDPASNHLLLLKSGRRHADSRNRHPPANGLKLRIGIQNHQTGPRSFDDEQKGNSRKNFEFVARYHGILIVRSDSKQYTIKNKAMQANRLQ
jgi:hypothetical protein